MIDEFREWQSEKDINPEEALEFLNEKQYQVGDIITLIVVDLVNLEKRLSQLEDEND